MNYNDEGVEAPVSDDAFELDVSPALQQYQTTDEQEYWIAELAAAQKERLKFDERGRKTIKRYADERDAGELNKSYFNVFFANTEMKMAALYARTPQPDIKRRYDDPDDDVSRVAANLLQRNISYELECGDFDARIKQMLFDRVVPGLGVGWVRFEQEEGPATFDAVTGQPVENITKQESEIDYVAWDDFHWSPCRVWTECRWVARKVPMSKDAIKSRFGDTAPADVLAHLPYVVTAANKVESKDALKPRNLTQATVDVYEFWDKERRLVFWVSPSGSVPLDVQADTNEFAEFFPTPLPPLGRFSTSSTLPISDYSLVQNQYIELDDLNDRSTKLIKAMQVRWVYNAEEPALKDLFQTAAEGQGIPVKNWAAFSGEKGGVKGSMEFTPLDEIAGTYNKLIQAREAVKAQIYEVEGISDLMRGAPTPYESASATTMKGKLSSSRMAVAQREVASYVEGLLRLKAHLICRFYTPQIILQRAGQLPQADTQYIGQALQLLKSVPFNHFRLLVSVDSIQLPNWNDEKQERSELMQAVSAYLGQTLPAVQQHPQLAPLVIGMLKFAIAGYKGARDFEGMLDQQLEQIAASTNQPQQPPKPTDGELKAQAQQMRIQADMQIAQLEEKTKLQMAQMQAQMKQMDLQLKTFEAQTRARAVDATIQDNQARQHIDALKAAHSDALDVVGFMPGGQ